MPELPEVQSTVEHIKPQLVGKKIKHIDCLWPGSIQKMPVDNFAQAIKDAEITDVFRRAKYIILCLNRKTKIFHLSIHLRMSGFLDVLNSKLALDKHDRLIFELSDGRDLRFNDVRKFGKISYLENYNDFSACLGLEPLSPDFNFDWFYSRLQQKNVRIKPLLLNQKFIVGIGNIYADESLWFAKIHPATPAKDISKQQAKLLVKSIKDVLNTALSHKGTDFGDNVVSGGQYSTKVYGREGLACERCETSISKISLAQRGTHFCPICQKLLLAAS